MEAVKVINKQTSCTEKLTVHLSPHTFCPTRFGYSQMQAAFVKLVPIFCRDDMSEAIIMCVNDHFWIACCSRCEVNQHIIIDIILNPFEFSRIFCTFRIKVSPAVTISSNDKFLFYIFVFFKRLLNMICNISVSGSNNVVYICCFKTIGVILFHKLICCRNEDSADLIKCKKQYPELIVSFKN